MSKLIQRTKSDAATRDIDGYVDLFILIFLVSALSMILIRAVRPNSTETWDKITLITCIISSLIIANFKNLENRFARNLIIKLTAVIVLIIGIFGIERKHGFNAIDYSRVFWLGFGPFVLALTFLLAVFVGSMYRVQKTTFSIKIILNLLAFTTSLFVLPAIWQGGNSVIDPGSTSYMVNENLAVSAGHYPYVDFIPQYSSLFSWALLPFKHIFTPEKLVTTSLYLMSLVTIITLLLSVRLIYRSSGRRSLSLSILLVIPITSVVQFPREGFTGTIFQLPSQLPIRLFPGILVASLLFRNEPNNSTRNYLKYYWLLPSFLVGINLWNNQDFGLALLATFVIFAFTMRGRTEYHRIFSQSSIGGILGFVTYPAALGIFAHKVDFTMFGTFVKGFGSGFGGEPIKVFGPALVVLPLIISLNIVSFKLIRNRIKRNTFPSNTISIALRTSYFFSTYCFFGFFYYLNRSYASGQLQILLLPLSIALSSLMFELITTSEKLFAKNYIFNGFAFRSETKNFERLTTLITVGAMAALPIGCLAAFPNPKTEISRLISHKAEIQLPTKNQLAAFDFAKLVRNNRSNQGKNIGYFGLLGNYEELEAGLPSASVFNTPTDLVIAQSFVNRECKFLAARNFEFLVVDEAGQGISEKFNRKELCGTFKFIDGSGNKLLQRIS